MLHRGKIREVLKCVKYFVVTVNIKQYSAFAKSHLNLGKDNMIFSKKTSTLCEKTTC